MNKIIGSLLLCTSCSIQAQEKHSIAKNGMDVSWYYKNDRIFFEMSAPTDGWVTIGFNTNSSIKGASLLMGNMKKGKPNVVEYYTISVGNYKAITKLGAIEQVKNVNGKESNKKTILIFSLPIKAFSKYQKDLSKGKKYTMILAYSQKDDFEHHSIMRTSINVKL